jgi:phosphoheptose isomerase
MIFPNKKYISCRDFYIDYNNKLSQTFNDKHFNELSKITKFLEKKIKTKNQIFVCGNGGSASISNHFLCDFNKGIKSSSKYKIIPKVISLANSIELITAIANDISFGKIFKNQLENLGNKNDVILIFSCSGKSQNILQVVKLAQQKKIDVISFIGFSDNNYLKKNSKFYINLDTKNYGLTEDLFQSIMHMISQYLRIKYLNNKKEIL